MIIVRLRGGLGNQLFQFAAAYSLAIHKGVELKSDLYTYTKHPYRKYELHNFNIQLPEATRGEVHRFTGNSFLSRYLNKKNNYLNCPNVFAQPHYHFYDDFFSLPAPLYLSGYWQSEKYFANVAPSLRKLITPASPLDQTNSSMMATTNSCESVALHIRRTDYTGAQKGLSFFQPMGLDYYERAIEMINQKVSDPHYFIFSDDIAWSKQQLKSLKNAVFVEHNTGANSYKDLLLMASCRHQIIANSTFSWWAAWLNDFAGKIVVAPETWFHNTWLTNREPVYACRYYNTRDLIPSGWIRL